MKQAMLEAGKLVDPYALPCSVIANQSADWFAMTGTGLCGAFRLHYPSFPIQTHTGRKEQNE